MFSKFYPQIFKSFIVMSIGASAFWVSAAEEELSIVPVSESVIQDDDADGFYDALNLWPTNLNVQNFSTKKVVSTANYDLAEIAGLSVQKVYADIRIVGIANGTSSVLIYGFPHDAQITLDDALEEAVVLGSYNPSDEGLGDLRIELDVNAFMSILENHGAVSLRFESNESGANTQLKGLPKLSFVVTSQPGGVERIDQQQVRKVSNFSVDYYAPVGQSFTPTVDEISFIDIHMVDLSGASNGSQVFLQLREGDMNGPLVAATNTESLSDCFNFSAGEGCGLAGGHSVPVRFGFQDPVQLTPGSLYTFEISNNGDAVGVSASNADEYTGGQAFQNGEATYFDLAFSTGYYADATHVSALPTPDNAFCAAVVGNGNVVVSGSAIVNGDVHASGSIYSYYNSEILGEVKMDQTHFDFEVIAAPDTATDLGRINYSSDEALNLSGGEYVVSNLTLKGNSSILVDATPDDPAILYVNGPVRLYDQAQIVAENAGAFTIVQSSGDSVYIGYDTSTTASVYSPDSTFVLHGNAVFNGSINSRYTVITTQSTLNQETVECTL